MESAEAKSKVCALRQCRGCNTGARGTPGPTRERAVSTNGKPTSAPASPHTVTCFMTTRARRRGVGNKRAHLAGDQSLENLPGWIEEQLRDLYSLLKDNPERARAELRRLNLHLKFTPLNLESDNPYHRVEGQCDVSALAFFRFGPKLTVPSVSFLARSRRPGAPTCRNAQSSPRARG
jgi:hypothetical protein